jgi:hypothetical protein
MPLGLFPSEEGNTKSHNALPFMAIPRHADCGHGADILFPASLADTEKPAKSLTQQADLVAGAGFEPATFRL